ncbi:MAG: hypothetical protein HY661_09485 [Betaproteobacteria bacterium]|nr:hypothetical protein [Betaproteobacteria bacterium]
MKTIVIGPGRIGCGFAGQLLRSSDHEVTFLARNRELVEHLNRLERYQVRLTDGVECREIIVDGVRAVGAESPDAAARELADADLIVTAVGAGNLASIAPLIAAGLSRREAPVNVLAFENLSDAGAHLRRLVASYLPHGFPIASHGFSGAVVSRAVTRMLGNPAADEPLKFVGDPPEDFVVSGPDLRGSLAQIQGMIVAEDLSAWMKRKLYIFSAGHATCAYLGFLKGYHYIHTAIRDPEIRDAVLAAMREGQRGLAALYGAEFAGGESDLLDIVKRFENAALQDTVTRVGRDPSRKLASGDRLVGAAQLAQKAGVRPEGLGLAAAAALCFDPDDPSSARLQHEINSAGLDQALHRVCDLDPNRGLGRLVGDAWARLALGWQKDNVLLSLNRMLWAWKSTQHCAALHARRGAHSRKRRAKDAHRFAVRSNRITQH